MTRSGFQVRTFEETLADGPWYVEIPDGRYLASSQDVDAEGNHYLGLVQHRAQASKFEFQIIGTQPTPRVVLAEYPSTKQAFVAANNFVMLGRIGTPLNVEPNGPTTFRLIIDDKGLAFGSRAQFHKGVSTPMRLATDPDAGPRPWRRKLADGLVGQPAQFGGQLFVAGDKPLLTCVDAVTGRTVWRYEPSLTATSPTSVSWTERLAIVAAGKTVHAVSVDTGTGKWTFSAPSDVIARPRAAGDLIYICCRDGFVHAIAAATGGEQWKFTKPLVSITTTPTLSDGTLYVRASDGVHAINPLTKTERWVYGANGTGAILAEDGALYFGDSKGMVTALRGDKTRIWQKATDGSPIRSRPALFEGQLLAVTGSGRLYSFDKETGTQRWVRMLSGQVKADIIVADSRVYIPTTAGKLHVITIDSKGPKLTINADLNGEVSQTGAIPISNGVARVSSAGGVLEAYSGGRAHPADEQDLTMLLRAADAANWFVNGRPSVLPPGATLLGSVPSDKAKRFGTAMVLSLPRAANDERIILVAFGIDPTAKVEKDSVKTVPASIIGKESEAIQASSNIITAYTSMRAPIVSHFGELAGKTVMVTGFGLAAGFATLAAVDYRSNKPAPQSVVCVTFGAPPIGNVAFAKQYEDIVPFSLRAIVPGDVTATQVRDGWAHTGELLTLGTGSPAPPVLGTTELYARVLRGVS